VDNKQTVEKVRLTDEGPLPRQIEPLATPFARAFVLKETRVSPAINGQDKPIVRAECVCRNFIANTTCGQ
jgi:hypothetical protein